jgi:hypothetical protein
LRITTLSLASTPPMAVRSRYAQTRCPHEPIAQKFKTSLRLNTVALTAERVDYQAQSNAPSIVNE